MQIYSEPPTIVHCPKCDRWWRLGNKHCLVNHHGDGCCHYGDTEVPPPGEHGGQS